MATWVVTGQDEDGNETGYYEDDINNGSTDEESNTGSDYHLYMKELGVPVDIIENVIGTPVESTWGREGRENSGSSATTDKPDEPGFEWGKLFDPKYQELLKMLGTGINSGLSDKRKQEAADKVEQNKAIQAAIDRGDKIEAARLINEQNVLAAKTKYAQDTESVANQNAFNLTREGNQNTWNAEQKALDRANALAIANLRGGSSGGGGGSTFSAVGSYVRPPGK